MAFNSIDLIVGALILLLGLKGVLGGFLRELFSFAGLVGGVFLASRSAEPLAAFVERKFVHLANPAFGRLIAFVLILALVWGAFSWLGNRIGERRAQHPLSTAERIGGFLIAALKYFMIFAMILSALERTPAIHNKLRHHLRGSRLVPVLVETGSALIHLSPLQQPKSGKKSR